MEQRRSAVMTILGLILLSGSAFGQQDVKARFNMLGVSGYVEFTEKGQDTLMLVNLHLPRAYTWEIREFPIIVAHEDPCNDSMVGNMLYDITSSVSGVSNSSENATATLSDIPLVNGNQAILGRTLLLRSEGERVCAPILANEHPISFAVVNGHVAGNVHVQKVGARYAVLTDLFSTQTMESKNYRGSISADLPNSKVSPSTIQRCEIVTEDTDLAELPTAPVAGAGKQIRSMVYITPNDISFDFSDGYLHIQTDTGISCANFHKYETKAVEATFNSKGLMGSILFTQTNPYKPTTMAISLKGLNKTAGGYHVHQFPIGYKHTADSDICGSSEAGGHFSPLPVSSGPTQDYAEIGDLSTKHGSFESLEDVDASYDDWYLPLFGEYSIVGRSIVIHATDSSRWVCANIGYPGPIVTAIAKFDFFAEGMVTFTQEKDKPWSDTTVLVKMAKAGFQQEKTTDHKYHIHQTPVSGDAGSTTKPCASTGGHWNPYGVNVADEQVYAASCSASNLGCEVGDLNGKFETITLEGSDSYKKYFYSNDIPLSGAYSVIGKSITIHEKDAGAGRYACADIKEQLQVHATLPTHGDDSIKFSESERIGVTKLVVELGSLKKNGGGYHVHQVTLDTENPGDNVCDTTGGHFNPYNANSHTSGETFDRYEVGDLSTKYGDLTELSALSFSAYDTNLPVRGYNSIVGRSVVIHKTDGEKWRCYDVGYDTVAMSATLIQAISVFTGDVDGRIILSQAVNEFGSSDVIIDVVLSYKDGRDATKEHSWHVHVDTYDGKSCATTGGHYNPYGVDITLDEIYPDLCGPANPQKCEMGDMSGKLGKLQIGNRYRVVYTDNFLSLVGDNSVVGRSIVIHGAESSPARLDCADIKPFGNTSKTIDFFIPKQTDNAYRKSMAAIIADQLGVSPSAVYVDDKGQEGDCTSVRVYLTGLTANDMLDKFDPQFLGEFAEADACGDTGGSSRTTLLSLWLFTLTISVALILPL